MKGHRETYKKDVEQCSKGPKKFIFERTRCAKKDIMVIKNVTVSLYENKILYFKINEVKMISWII
jgi:hypothetical protein